MISKTTKPRAGWAEPAKRVRARNDDHELLLGLLAEDANKSLAHMIDKLNEAHTAISHLKKSLMARKRSRSAKP
ncbi:MAG: hypothetical protein HP497_10240 [Nitrospira sp.]|nr:hypothetical protein [Nitrospira sp.]